MELREAIATVHNALINVVEDSLGRDSREAKLLDDAWAVIQDKVGPLVSPSESPPQNEYSSGSANPGIEELRCYFEVKS